MSLWSFGILLDKVCIKANCIGSEVVFAQVWMEVLAWESEHTNGRNCNPFHVIKLKACLKIVVRSQLIRAVFELQDARSMLRDWSKNHAC